MELIAKLLLLLLLAPHMIGVRATPVLNPNALTQTAYIGETEKNNETRQRKS